MSAELQLPSKMNDCDTNENIVTKRRCRYRRHIHQRTSISRHKERIVLKTGELNIENSNKSKYYELPDFISLCVEVRWRWTILYCVLAYVSNWLLYAIIWCIIVYMHGDLEFDQLPRNTTESQPCVREIHSFTSVFLFSIEIDTSIGYGKRTVTIECTSAMFTMCIESITGKIIQSVIIGTLFAKLSRPKNRAKTLIFSRNILVNQRETNLCMMFRVGNVRKSRIIGVTIAAYLIKLETVDGDALNYNQVELKLELDSSALFNYPITALHVINKSSPFYNISAYNMLKSNLEIIVVIEGTIESTGQIVQAKSSYINYDILWGRRFVSPIFYRKERWGFSIDYAKFDEKYRINTPLCTAKDLYEYYEARKQFEKSTQLKLQHILI